MKTRLDARYPCFLPTRAPIRSHTGVKTRAGPTKQTKSSVEAPLLSRTTRAT